MVSGRSWEMGELGSAGRQGRKSVGLRWEGVRAHDSSQGIDLGKAQNLPLWSCAEQCYLASIVGLFEVVEFRVTKTRILVSCLAWQNECLGLEICTSMHTKNLSNNSLVVDDFLLD